MRTKSALRRSGRREAAAARAARQLMGAGLLRRVRALPGNARGCLWAVAAMLAFGSMEAIIKHLGAAMHPMQIVFFRCLFAFAAIAPVVLVAGGVAHVATRRLGAHFARTVLGFSAMATGFFAITQMPLADAVALGFVRPLFLVLLAVLFLGEQVRWRRWTATAVGFAGVVVMVQPGADGLNPYALVALLSGFLVACVSVALKRLSETESAETTVFWFAAMSTVLAAGPALLVWRTPTPAEWPFLVALGVLGSIGQYFIVRAYRVAEATAVDPMDYGRLILAAASGVLVFGETLQTHTLAGAAIIAASTFYIARREAKLTKRP
jgi:drug/metabolite transporter (DMT)-like permease